MQIYTESICIFFYLTVGKRSERKRRQDSAASANRRESLNRATINFQVLFVADFIKQEMEPWVFSAKR